MRVPGQPAVPGAARLGAIPTGAPRRTELPDIFEPEPGDAMPCICLIGDSGTGKTHQLGRLIAHLRRANLSTLYIDIENKWQEVARFLPKVLPIGAPVKVPVSPEYPAGLRKSTHTERYHRLIEVRDRLGRGEYREHNGLPIGAIVTDGLTELGDIFKAHKLATALPGSTGGVDTRRAWGDMGDALVDFMASLKEAASANGKAFGLKPLPIVVTVVETLKDGKFIPLLPGNIAPDNFARQFETVMRLAVESADPDTSTMQYVAHTMGGEVFLPQTGRWIAKAPDGVFDAKIVNPDLGTIFDKLIAYYRGESPSTTDATV